MAKLIIPAAVRRIDGQTYYIHVSNVAKAAAEREARMARRAGLRARVVRTGSKWSVYSRA